MLALKSPGSTPGLILSFDSLWFLLIGEAVVSFSTLIRCCKAMGTQNFPIILVVPSLMSMSLPKRNGAPRNHQEQVGKYLTILATERCLGESLCECFSCVTQNGRGLGEEVYRIGCQDRVGSPSVHQKNFRPTCSIQLYPWLLEVLNH